jgi:hypothetical protein
MGAGALSEREEQLIAVLDRGKACDSLAALVSAMKRETSPASLEDTAIGLDANVFLRLAGHPKSADIIDYLSSRHSAPLILPGQAIQEFWNNQLQVVDTVAVSLRKQFENFKAALSKVDKDLVEQVTEVGGLLDRFSAEYGHVYDEATVHKTVTLMDAVVNKAAVPYATRGKFQRNS